MPARVFVRSFSHGLGLIVAACVLTVNAGCASSNNHGRRHPSGDPRAKPVDPREDGAKTALVAAKEQNTVDAYTDVIKRFSGTNAADEAKLELARVSTSEARSALSSGDRAAARQHARTAKQWGDPMIAQQANVVLDQIDRADVRAAVSEVKRLLPTGACKDAVELVANTLGEDPSPALLNGLRSQTLRPLSDCMEQAVRKAHDRESLFVARSLVESAAAQRALGDGTWNALLDTLGDRATGLIASEISPELQAGKWEPAFAKIKEWSTHGSLGPQHADLAKQQARDAITTEVLQKAEASIGKRGGTTTLKELDRALGLFTGMNVDGALKETREQLATWVQCERLGCALETKPRVAYTLGSVPLLPSSDVTQASTEALPHATKVQIIARGNRYSLVTRENRNDADTAAERVGLADGWVESTLLKPQDTTEWLPVGKALENERVWLPSGRDDGLYLLGVVTAVGQKDVTVKKLSDGLPTTLRRTDLRNGHLAKGLRVLAFCSDQLNLSEAQVELILPQVGGAPLARVHCGSTGGTSNGDSTRNAVLGSLRAKPDWLPPRKP